MPQTAIGADLLEALDAESHLAAELALHLELLVDDLAEAGDLLVAELVNPRVRIDVGGAHHPGGRGWPDPVDVLHGDDHALVARDVDSGYARQISPAPVCAWRPCCRSP